MRVEIQVIREIYDDLNMTWDKMMSNLKIVFKSILGESRGQTLSNNKSWQ